MSNRTGDAPEGSEALPPGLAAWFSIEECASETLDALMALGGNADAAIVFVADIHRRVRLWLSWELWAGIVDPGLYTPDSLLRAVLTDAVDVCQLPRSGPASPPVWAGTEWRAFGEDSDDA